MMPGVGRRARLLVDWNIGLLFGRDTAELGGVGGRQAARERSAQAAGRANGAAAVRRRARRQSSAPR